MMKQLKVGSKPEANSDSVVDNETTIEQLLLRCRLCLIDKNMPLSRMWNCSKVPFVHDDCLQAYILETNKKVCEICEQPFKMKSFPKEASGKQMSTSSTKKKEKIFLFFSSFVDRAILILTIWIACVHLNPWTSWLDILIGNYLLLYAVVYLIFVITIGNLRCKQLYHYLTTPQQT